MTKQLSDAEQFLVEQDDKLAPYILTQGHIEWRAERDYFEALATSIVSQQISVKAAAKIFARFRDQTMLLPERILKMSDEQIKTIGLSRQKVRYLRDLSTHFVEDSAVFDHLGNLSDDETIIELTRVKGIGIWTAQMFLIFTLHRLDIFAPDDRGLQVAIENIYSVPATTTRAELEQFSMRWRPYRSVACLHLWYSLNNTPS